MSKMCGIPVCFVTEMKWLTFLDMIQHSDLHVVQMYHGINPPPTCIWIQQSFNGWFQVLVIEMNLLVSTNHLSFPHTDLTVKFSFGNSFYWYREEVGVLRNKKFQRNRVPAKYFTVASLASSKVNYIRPAENLVAQGDR